MANSPKLTWETMSGSYRRIATFGIIPDVSSLGRRLLRILAMPAVLLLYLVLCGIDVFRPVRIGRLNRKGRITIMVSYLEGYLRGLRLGGAKFPFVIVINFGGCPNEQLTKMYRRTVLLLDDKHSWLRRWFLLAYDLMVRLRSSMVVRLGGPNLLKGYSREWQVGSPVLWFTADENEAGSSLLKRMGISDGTPYVCFGLREEAYYQQFLNAKSRRRDANPEAGPDTYIRNPPLKNYLPMAVQCATRGLYVLRMGQVVGEPVPAELHPNIIDYAWKHRRPFGDIYLLATCRFVVGGGAGLWWVASAFNRPVVLSDVYFIQTRPLRKGDLFIPAKFWHVSEKRFLTFREMLAGGMRYSYESNCRCDGIELVHNTPEEIGAVVEEMNQRLDGTWQSNEEDDDLQERLTLLYLPEHYGYGLPGRMGTKFLREYKHLLD